MRSFVGGSSNTFRILAMKRDGDNRLPAIPRAPALRTRNEACEDEWSARAHVAPFVFLSEPYELSLHLDLSVSIMREAILTNR